MTTLENFSTAISCLLFCLLAEFSFAQKNNRQDNATSEIKTPKFIRYITEKNTANRQLQTSISRYKAGKNLQLDLVAVVHIADPEYFDELNKVLSSYDVVLYEGLKKENPEIGLNFAQSFFARTSAEPEVLGKERDDIGIELIFSMQQGMKKMLGFEFQLKGIDYLKPNFIHADMSFSEFQKIREQNEENFVVMYLRSLQSQSVARKTGRLDTITGIDLLAMLSSENKQDRIKHLLAEQFSDMDMLLESIEGPNGSVIIGKRNDVAIEKLKKFIKKSKKGKNHKNKKIAIFYGAAHMPDFHKKITEGIKNKKSNSSIRLKLKDQKWLTAWNFASY